MEIERPYQEYLTKELEGIPYSASFSRKEIKESLEDFEYEEKDYDIWCHRLWCPTKRENCMKPHAGIVSILGFLCKQALWYLISYKNYDKFVFVRRDF